jgi:hypothetical protein
MQKAVYGNYINRAKVLFPRSFCIIDSNEVYYSWESWSDVYVIFSEPDWLGVSRDGFDRNVKAFFIFFSPSLPFQFSQPNLKE